MGWQLYLGTDSFAAMQRSCQARGTVRQSVTGLNPRNMVEVQYIRVNEIIILSRRLKIGFNFLPFSTSRRGGVLYYSLNLLRELSRLRSGDVVIFLRPDAERWLRNRQWFSRLTVIQVHEPHQILEHRSRFDLLYNLTCRGSVHGPDFPIITFLPDIQHKYYPQFFSTVDLGYRNAHYPQAIHSSTVLITPSNYSKLTIIKNFPIREENVKVVHHGLHPIFFEGADPGPATTDLPAGIGRYLFYPANSWRHKNHQGLLDALLMLKEQSGIEIPLILTGQLFCGEHNHFDIVREMHLRGLESQVFHLGLVPIATVKQLYVNSAALIFPSFFEGFGLPLAEAMSCGCAIIASRRSSIPEIAGKAALYFNPDDPSDIAEKIRHFVNNPGGAQRRVQIGKQRANLFVARKVAEEHLSVFQQAYQMVIPKTRTVSARP
jgi:glycosyltransferase involved in cell wall biosynthesis